VIELDLEKTAAVVSLLGRLSDYAEAHPCDGGHGLEMMCSGTRTVVAYLLLAGIKEFGYEAMSDGIEAQRVAVVGAMLSQVAGPVVPC